MKIEEKREKWEVGYENSSNDKLVQHAQTYYYTKNIYIYIKNIIINNYSNITSFLLVRAYTKPYYCAILNCAKLQAANTIK